MRETLGVFERALVRGVEEHRARELAAATGARLHLSAEGGEGWQYAFAQADGGDHGDPGRDGAELAAALRERKVLVRHFRRPERIAPFLRISVGTDEQTDALLAALNDALRATLAP